MIGVTQRLLLATLLVGASLSLTSCSSADYAAAVDTTASTATQNSETALDDSAAPASNDGSAVEPDATPAPPSMPDELAAADYYDQGDGVAWKWAANTECKYGAIHGCVHLHLAAYEECSNGIRVTLNALATKDGEPLDEVTSYSDPNLGAGDRVDVEFDAPVAEAKWWDVQSAECSSAWHFASTGGNPTVRAAGASIDAPPLPDPDLSGAGASSDPQPLPDLPSINTGSGSDGGYTVTCADGTLSNAGGKQGACSWHGGVG